MNCIFVYSNEQEESVRVAASIRDLLEKEGFRVPRDMEAQVDLMVCVGGDGTLLRALHTYNFPDLPVVGVNTGHLGFFQELSREEGGRIVDMCRRGAYSLQSHRLVCAQVVCGQEAPFELTGLNDIVIRGADSRIIHLNLSIGDSFIEKFSGDGLVIASSAGSTAYNYSLGGSIVDPRLNLLQVTPIAPMNTTAYRCFTSSIVLPPDQEVRILPVFDADRSALVVVDGMEHLCHNIRALSIGLSERQVHLVRLGHYDFWSKVKAKFL